MMRGGVPVFCDKYCHCSHSACLSWTELIVCPSWRIVLALTIEKKSNYVVFQGAKCTACLVYQPLKSCRNLCSVVTLLTRLTGFKLCLSYWEGFWIMPLSNVSVLFPKSLLSEFFFLIKYTILYARTWTHTHTQIYIYIYYIYIVVCYNYCYNIVMQLLL